MDKKEAIKELTLNEKLSLIQVDMKAKKSRFNSFGKYNFRSAEDLLEAVKPYLTKYNVKIAVKYSPLTTDMIIRHVNVLMKLW